VVEYLRVFRQVGFFIGFLAVRHERRPHIPREIGRFAANDRLALGSETSWIWILQEEFLWPKKKSTPRDRSLLDQNAPADISLALRGPSQTLR
jgi:hypothetical protein